MQPMLSELGKDASGNKTGCLEADAEPKNPTCLTPLAVATEGNQAGKT